MKILSIGSFNGNSNTCLHRNWALQKLGNVDMVNMYEKPISLWFRIANKLFNWGLPLKLPDLSNCNQQIYALVENNNYDIVWIDKGWLVCRETLEYIKNVSPETLIVSYSPDNMALRHNQSQQYLDCVSLYDFIFTNKSYILEDMKRLGARRIKFVNNSYEDSFHYPRQLSETDWSELGGDVGFVGMWEQERCESILYLAKNGVNVRVFGGGKWVEYKGKYTNLQIENKGLYGKNYSKSFQTFKISLCFLRKMNFDQQTTRTMEIPACGGFMLAERTEEHLSLFEEGKEADFFSSNEELLEKCRYYLNHESERRLIAEAGTKRCKTSGYSNKDAIEKMLNEVFRSH
jgi:spore maturation protein CgeB